MFAQNGGASFIGGVGKAMQRAGSNLRDSAPRAAGGGVSPRQYKKILQASIDAHRQFSEIDTEHRGRRIDQTSKAMKDLADAGFHNIRHETADVNVSASRDPYAPSAPAADTSYNPSHDVHGHPGAGFTQTHGYSGDAASAGVKVISITPRAVTTSRPAPAAPTTPAPIGTTKPTLAIGYTPSEKQVGERPGTAAPKFVAGPSGVTKKGSKLDKPEKSQPEIPGKLRSKTGAIPMKDSSSKGKLRGPKLNKPYDN